MPPVVYCSQMSLFDNFSSGDEAKMPIALAERAASVSGSGSNA